MTMREATMREATIREAHPGDLPACAAIVNDWVDEVDWLPRIMSREQTASLFGPDLLEKRTVLVADEDGAILGYLSLDEADAYIRALYLAPAARGRGIGKALMDAAKARSPDGLSLGVFEPNRARAFYAREGFREVPEGRKGTHETEEGVAELLMEWSPR